MFKKDWNPFYKPDPKEVVRKCQANIRKEVRSIERQMMDVERERKKAEKLIKEAVQRSDVVSARVLAKEYRHMQKTVAQLAMNKANMISLSTQMAQQLAVVRVSGTLGKSAEVMKLMNGMIKVPQLMATMRDMSKELYKAGVIDEMVTDAMESVAGADEEEESEELVDRVLVEVAGETLAEMAAAPKRKQAAAVAAAAEEEEEADALQARLDAVRT